MTAPTVTVILPTFNRAPFLTRVSRGRRQENPCGHPDRPGERRGRRSYISRLPVAAARIARRALMRRDYPGLGDGYKRGSTAAGTGVGTGTWGTGAGTSVGASWIANTWMIDWPAD